jgi:hypothetical protein
MLLWKINQLQKRIRLQLQKKIRLQPLRKILLVEEFNPLEFLECLPSLSRYQIPK